MTARPFSRWRIARRRMYGSATWCICIAVMTRVGTPVFSSASCRAMALMTVASMPMWSAATRSIFLAAAATPRKKLPPPTTSPICTPVLTTSAISAARLLTRSGSIPKDPPPASASPLSLRTMRWYLGTDGRLTCSGGAGLRPASACAALTLWRRRLRCFLDQRRLAYLEANEARDRNVLTKFCNRRFDQVADAGGVIADERLLVQADLFVELAHPPFHDLVHHFFWLAFLQGPPPLDVALFVQNLLCDVLFADELWVRGRHLHGQILHQILEIVGPGNEVGLAVHLHQHAQLRAGMDITAYDALPCSTRRLLRCRSDSVLTENDFRFRQIALGLDQGFLALHHARAGSVAELFH